MCDNPWDSSCRMMTINHCIPWDAQPGYAATCWRWQIAAWQLLNKWIMQSNGPDCYSQWGSEYRFLTATFPIVMLFYMWFFALWKNQSMGVSLKMILLFDKKSSWRSIWLSTIDDKQERCIWCQWLQLEVDRGMRWCELGIINTKQL